MNCNNIRRRWGSW